MKFNLSDFCKNALSILDKAFHYASNVYCILIIGILPIYYNNNYFDILEAKRIIFVAMTIGLFLVFLLCYGTNLFLNIYEIKVQVTDIFMILLMISILLGTIFSKEFERALIGSEGWGIGAYYIILCIFTYFAIKNIRINWKCIEISFFISFEIVIIIGSLHILNIDFLGLKEGLISKEMYNYISTIGNINWYGAYISLGFPIIASVFIIENRLYHKILLGIIYILTFINMVMCNSDCALISMIGLLLFFMYCFIKKKEYIKGWSQLIVISGIAMLLNNMITDKYGYYNIGDLQQLLTHNQIGIMLIVIGALLFLGAFFKKRRNKIIYRIAIIIIILFAILIAWHEGKDAIIKYTNFNKEWGTNRGYIWSYAVKIFKKSTVLEKIFGRGCDTFGIYANVYFESEISSIWSKKLVNAHSEFLQMLVTTGVAGVTFYYGAIIYQIYKGLVKDNIIVVIMSISLLTYLIQQLINNQQTITMPLSFLILGIMANIYEN